MIDPATQRRMTMYLYVKLPAADARARQWERLAKAEGVHLSPVDASAIAPQPSQAARRFANLSPADARDGAADRGRRGGGRRRQHYRPPGG